MERYMYNLKMRGRLGVKLHQTDKRTFVCPFVRLSADKRTDKRTDARNRNGYL